jgi:hypothetical protein
MKLPPVSRWPRVIRWPLGTILAILTSPIWVPVRLGARFRRERTLKGFHDEADLLLYQKRWEELADFCEGSLWFFPGDEKLTLVWAMALAETDPAKAAELAGGVAFDRPVPPG